MNDRQDGPARLHGAAKVLSAASPVTDVFRQGRSRYLQMSIEGVNDLILGKCHERAPYGEAKMPPRELLFLCDWRR